jgi:hypothetical protein
MVYRNLLRSIFVLAPLLYTSHSAVAVQNDTTAFLQTMQKIVKEKGGRLLILLGHHKKYCWDGTDPDASDVADYREIVGALGVLELGPKFKAAVNPLLIPLDNYIEYRLALAGAALKSNCLNIADEQYRAVLKEFTHPIYNRYRDLAKIGVDDVREKRAAQAAVDQKHASPSRVPWELVGEWLPQSDDLVPEGLGKCKPTSPSDSDPFSLKPDGSWGKLITDAASSSCILTVVPFLRDRQSWKVTSTCQPQVTEVWWQLGSARDRITTHDLIDNSANGGKKSVGSTKVEYRRCD